jgi:hypothetical protein
MYTRLLFVLLSFTLFIPNLSSAEDDGIDHAEKVVLKVNENGFDPAEITLHHEDSSIFVVNTSQASLLTIKIDFKGRKAHCSSPNLEFNSNGVLESNKPIGPKDFAGLCIPEKGVYEVVAYGLTEKPIESKITVVTE